MEGRSTMATDDITELKTLEVKAEDIGKVARHALEYVVLGADGAVSLSPMAPSWVENLFRVVGLLDYPNDPYRPRMATEALWALGTAMNHGDATLLPEFNEDVLAEWHESCLIRHNYVMRVHNKYQARGENLTVLELLSEANMMERKEVLEAVRWYIKYLIWRWQEWENPTK